MERSIKALVSFGGKTKLRLRMTAMKISLAMFASSKGSEEDLNRVIKSCELLVAANTEYPSEYITSLIWLGNLLELRFRANGRLEDLDRSIEVQELALSFGRENNPDYVQHVYGGFPIDSR